MNLGRMMRTGESLRLLRHKLYFSEPNQTCGMPRADKGYTEQVGKRREWISHLKRRLDPKSKYAFVSKLNRENALVLDVGCGLDSVRKLRQHAPLATFDGADITEYYMTNEGKKSMRHYWIFPPEIFIDELVAQGETYDGIILSHVIEHVPHPTEFLDKLVGLLKEGGRLYLSTPTLKSVHFPRVRQGCLNFYDDPTHTAPFDLERWAEAMKPWGKVSYTARHRGGFLLRCLAWLTVPYTLLTKRNTSLTWYAFGFESIAVIIRKGNILSS